jgi:hypothetical protein
VTQSTRVSVVRGTRCVASCFVGVMGVVVIACLLSGCSWLTPRTQSPVVPNQVVTAEQLQSQLDAALRAAAAREEVEAANRAARLDELSQQAQGELAVVDLGNAQSRKVLENQWSLKMTALRGAWRDEDAKQIQTDASLAAQFEAAKADLASQAASRGVFAQIVGQAAAMVPGVSAATGMDGSGLAGVLALLLGGGGAVYGVRKHAKTKDDVWVESEKHARDQQQREDAAWEEGRRTGEVSRQSDAITAVLHLVGHVLQTQGVKVAGPIAGPIAGPSNIVIPPIVAGDAPVVVSQAVAGAVAGGGGGVGGKDVA